MMEIFIITSYYPPEIGAASNRIMHLAEGLEKLGYQITVVTPMPNYPTGKIFKGFRRKFFHHSIQNNVKVVRLWLFASNSKNKIKRVLAMVSYSFSLTVFYLLYKVPKKVIVQSPPLLVAFTSMLWLKSRKRMLVLNISDLWPTAGQELGALKKGFALEFLKWMEHFNYRSADLILGQSNEILDHVSSILPHKIKFLYRNYPVIKKEIPLSAKRATHTKLSLVYAGLLGVAQGIFELCKKMDFSKVDLHIYGDGSEKHIIQQYLREHPNLPITYHGNLSRENLHDEIVKYDFGLIPLKNRIYGSVPSKIFEYALLGLPIVYFGGGEGENIVETYNLGVTVKAGCYRQLNNRLKIINISDYDCAFREKLRETANSSFKLQEQILDLTTLF